MDMKAEKLRGKILVGLIMSAIFAFLHGWMLMIAVDVAHEHWLTNLPTIGYWWAVVIVALLRGVFSPFSTSKSDRQ